MTRKRFLSLAGALLAAPFGARALARESRPDAYGINLIGDSSHPVLIRGGAMECKFRELVRDEILAQTQHGGFLRRMS